MVEDAVIEPESDEPESEPEILSDGEQIIFNRNDGDFGRQTLSHEEAVRRGKLGAAKQHYRKESSLIKQAERLTRATLSVMPALATPEANEARAAIVEQLSRLAVSDRGGAAISALSDLATRIGDSFQGLEKLQPGVRCPRCQGVVGRLPTKVLVKGKALTKSMSQMIGQWMREEGCPPQWVELAERLVVRIGCKEESAEAGLADS